MKKTIYSLAVLITMSSVSLAQEDVKTKTKVKKDKNETKVKMKVKSEASDPILNKEFTTESGLKYKITQRGTGSRAQAGDNVKVHYTGRLTDSTVFDTSVESVAKASNTYNPQRPYQPLPLKLGAGQVIKGWDEGIALLNVGDKAILTIPPALGYGDRAMGSIPANSTMIFEVELIEIAEKPKPYDVKGKDTIITSTGLKYIKLNNSNGVQAAPGKNVSVHYTGYFEDGKIFDSSVERGSPIEFPLGQGRVIKGWDEGIALLKKGEKARLVIPYHLAYGEAGRPPSIPAKSTLIFDVELMDVKDAVHGPGDGHGH